MLRGLSHPIAVALLAGAVTLPSCASQQQSPPPPAAETTRNLSGDWKLKTFTPDKPLDQPYQALLEAQLRALTVSFRGDQYFASGPGVNLQGRYVVTSAIGTTFQLTLFDPDGVAYPVAGRFRGAELDFQSQNERWRGTGVLVRGTTTP